MEEIVAAMKLMDGMMTESEKLAMAIDMVTDANLEASEQGKSVLAQYAVGESMFDIPDDMF